MLPKKMSKGMPPKKGMMMDEAEMQKMMGKPKKK